MGKVGRLRIYRSRGGFDCDIAVLDDNGFGYSLGTSGSRCIVV